MTELVNLPKCTGYTGDKCTSCESGYYAKNAGYCETQPNACSNMLDDGASCTLSNGYNAIKLDDNNYYWLNNTTQKSWSGMKAMCPSGTHMANEDEIKYYTAQTSTYYWGWDKASLNILFISSAVMGLPSFSRFKQ